MASSSSASGPALLTAPTGVLTPRGEEALSEQRAALALEGRPSRGPRRWAQGAEATGAGRADEADLAGVAGAADRARGLELQRPDLTFGTGAHIALATNHFLLKAAVEPGSAAWLAWQVEFPATAPEARAPGRGGGRGGGAAQRRPGRAVRAQGVRRALEQLRFGEKDWLFDGGHRLYTRGRQGPPGLAGRHSAWLGDGRPPLAVEVQPAMEDGAGGRQQELDLSRLGALGRDAIEGVREELRFLQVAMRSHAVDTNNLIAKGRRVLCPRGGLVDCAEVSLRHGRQLWMGYLANLEFIDDGLGVGGVRCSLSWNYSASVGLPEMPALDLLAHFMAEEWDRKRRHEGFMHYQRVLWNARDSWPQDLSDKLWGAMNSEMGLRKLRVKCDYFGHERRFSVVGVTQQPASRQYFWYEQEGRYVSVAEYFKMRWGKDLWCPGLPCLQLNKKDNCVPLELVTVLGAEHNLEVGKLRPEYQSDVSKLTPARPQQRRKNIQDIIKNDGMGPKAALLAHGMTLETSMLKVNGHCLDPPAIQGDRGHEVTPGHYAASFQAVAPPAYWVPWGLWCFTSDRVAELWGLARRIGERARAHNLWFESCSFVDYPREAWRAINRGAPAQELREALKQDLDEVRFKSANSALLFVLLPSDGRKDDIYKFLKVHTETELCSFATQCVVTPAERKLNNVMVKLPSKLRLKESSADTLDAQAAHNVRLKNPHWLLGVSYEAGSIATSTVVLGADVTHNAAGVSVAGVVATRGADFSTYLSELRAQSPFVLGADKRRTRKSEERILELTGMVASHLKRWRAANGERLPETVLYYRDGVSDGQFQPVLTMELNQLVEAFRQSGGPEYNPMLVIIVGQKRHQTRFFPDSDEARGGRGGGQAGGSWQGGWGSRGGDAGNVPPGTVAGEGIAQPGHLNFFLVSAQGIKGTSVPCHYHVLHADARLNVEAIDLEQVTFQLCHLYSRADKVVGYAAPAYYADHLCERGKLYLEAQYPDCIDIPSSAPASEDSEEQFLRKEVEDRCQWFNGMQAELCSSKGGNLQGRNFFC